METDDIIRITSRTAPISLSQDIRLISVIILICYKVEYKKAERSKSAFLLQYEY